jgi:hypothetical protein
MGAVFPHVYRYTNFGYASDRPLQPNFSLIKSVRRPDGSFFQTVAPPNSVVAALALGRIEPVNSFIARHEAADAWIISDDNLVTEYRHGRRFGPQLLQALQPAEAQEFKFAEP